MTNEMLVCCGVGDDQYALRATDVRQIVRAERMREASAPDGRVGTLEVAGRTVPVLSLGRVLAQPTARAAADSCRHVVVTGSDSGLVGWLVDHVERTRIGEDAAIAPLPPIVGPRAMRWFAALVRTGDTSRLLLALRSVGPGALSHPRTADGLARPGAERTAETPAPVLLFGTPALPRADVSRFAVSCRRIVGVAQELALTVVPGSVRHVAGLAWWRDGVVPVIDFRGGGASDGDGRRRCLIVRCNTRLGIPYIGLPVDLDMAMHQPRAEDRVAADVACPSFAAGVFAVGGRPVALLDIDALLDSERLHVEDVA